MATATLNETTQLVSTEVHEVLHRIVQTRRPEWKIDVADVQALVLRGHGALPACAYQLLTIDDGPRAQRFLASLVGEVASGLPGARDDALQVAFTHAGLRALGLADEALAGFSRQFIEGIVGPKDPSEEASHRSRFLGDLGDSAPECWAWGGPRTPPVHLVLMQFACDEARLARRLDERRRSFAGVTEIATLATSPLSSTEHFGFADGISQPAIDGYHQTESTLHRVKAGEFLLGYPNEYGQLTERPLIGQKHDLRGTLPLDVAGSPKRDLGRNGTYLVFRQLRQDVPAFRAALDRLTRRPDGTPDAAAQARLSAKMVGRWPSGASLVDTPDADLAGFAGQNEFRYHLADPGGVRCPIGAHVRRANPRDALLPKPGTESSLAVNRRHRLIRRGRNYGPPLAEGATDALDRGIMFIGVNANLSRQFEFIQHSWIGDPRFTGMQGEVDPIMGTGSSNEFSIPMDPVRRRCTDLPRFVTVSGGAYLFLPGLSALRFLSEMKP